MANITLIDPTKSVSLAPNILNTNFQNINTELSQIAVLLKPSTSSLELNHKVTAPNNGIETATIIATALNGLLFHGLVDGVTTVFTVGVDGLLVAKNIELDLALLSKFGSVENHGSVTNKENVISEKDSLVIGARLKNIATLVVIPSNVGNSASNPIDLSVSEKVLVDFSNGGSQFVAGGSDALLKIDKTTLKLGQTIKLHLMKKNGTNLMKLWNGDNSENLFAKMDMTNGITDIVYTTYPTFDDSAPMAWIELQYVEVSAGIFRLLILDSLNILNV